MRLHPSAFIPALLFALLSSCRGEATAHAAAKDSHGDAASYSGDAASYSGNAASYSGDAADSGDGASYSGTDVRGVPHYLTGGVSDDGRRVLRLAFGVVTPSNLYLSDSTPGRLLKYDPQTKRCLSCYVNSYRIGFVSIRKPAESWDVLQQRVRALRHSSFRPASLFASSSVSAMDPDVQGEVTQMLDAARRAGFRLRVVSTYRSPEEEALLMAQGRGRTHTLTSLHSYGRAIDVSIGDGNLGNPSTRRSWIAYRQWVTRFHGHDFRVLGTPDRSWDWAHVELPDARIGFRSVDDAINAGRACLARSALSTCEFLPHLPPRR